MAKHRSLCNVEAMTTTMKQHGGMLSTFKSLDYLVISHKMNKLGLGGEAGEGGGHQNDTA